MNLDAFFQISARGSRPRTELLAGLTTFMTMAYILAVNPAILGETGMDRPALFTATALSAALATLVMAFWARLPFALAPGMGLNAFFAYGIVLGMGLSWQAALGLVFVEGLLFIALTLFNLRTAIVHAIPLSLKHAISAGIGLFIALIGLKNAGVIVKDEAVLLGLGDVHSAQVWLMLGGLLLSAALLKLRIRGALLIGMALVTLAGIPFGLTQIPEGGLLSLPPSPAPLLFKLDLSALMDPGMILVLFSLLFVDLFDSIGTMVGVCDKAGFLDEQGRIPQGKEAFMADAIGTSAGALLGTSTVTVYVESASGVAEGARSGLSALAVAALFLLALFCAPLFLMVPAAATAPALVLVGLFMMSPLRHIDFEKLEEGFPAFLTLIMMPFTFSIAEGIGFGLLAHVCLQLLSGRGRQLSPLATALALVFVLKLLL